MKNEKRTGIKERLFKACTQIVAILSLAAVIAVVMLFLMSSKYESAMQYYGFSQGDIGKAMTAFAEARSSLRGAIGYDNEEEIAKLLKVYDEQKAAFEVHIAEVEKSMVTDEGWAAYDAIVEQLDAYWALSDDILAQGVTTDEEASALAQTRAFDELAPAYEAVYESLDNLMAVNVTKGDETHNTMSMVKIIVVVLMVAIIAVAVGAAAMISNKLSKGIVGPLNALGERLKRFTHGDLSGEFPAIDTKDEIENIVTDCSRMATDLTTIIEDVEMLLGEMANGNFTVDSAIEERYEGELKGLLAAIRKLNSELNGTLHQINSASDQVHEGANELAHSAQELAEGATEQAGAIEELTATIENVANIAEESAKNAQGAADMAQKSAVEAGKSQQDMVELNKAMESITATSREIENIIVAIEDIASQTNLLSLNASIEAARAGEAGRGFAVVADQIGKLAADSAQSAVTTRELIGNAISEVEKGNQIVEITNKAIEGVLDSMQALAGSATGAAQASQTQADMLEELKGGIEQISVVIQSNSASSQETSAISEELAAQAISLKDMVGGFKLHS